MTYWNCSTGLPPSGPREVKALVCQWSSKGCVAKPLSLICCWNTHTSVLCPWISPDKCHPAVSNSNVKKEKKKKSNKHMLDAVTFALHAVVLESAVLQVTCLRFGTIVTFRSLYHVAWVWACQSFQLFSFPVKVLDSLKWREQFEILSLKIDETWHMCLGGSGNI